MNLFDIANLKIKLDNLENETLKDGFWNDLKKSNSILAQLKPIKNKYNQYIVIQNELQNLEELTELVLLEFDFEIVKELIKNTKELEKNIEKLEICTLLSGKYDTNNAIVTIHPGAGGTESQDWAEMIYRMYTRWGNKNNYQINELDYLEGEEAGLKSVTFEVTGENAYRIYEM